MATGRQRVPHFQDGFVLFIVDCGQRTRMLAQVQNKSSSEPGGHRPVIPDSQSGSGSRTAKSRLPCAKMSKSSFDTLVILSQNTSKNRAMGTTEFKASLAWARP